MAEMTEAERQAQFQHDITIINRQADARITKLRADFAKTEARHLQAVERRKAEIIQKRNIWKNNIDVEAAKRKEGHDLAAEQEINAAIEADMKELDPMEERLHADIDKVEAWRRAESADEVRQLQTHTQRPRQG